MPQSKTAQDGFLGLYTEAKPETLPQGASPRAIDVDYIVGSVIPRPGKKSAFTYADNFFESSPAFSQSVGEGAVWSGGSVVLNNPSSGGPIIFTAPAFAGEYSPVGGHFLTLTCFGLNDPLVLVLPVVSQRIFGVGLFKVINVTDSEGNTWQQVQAPTPYSFGTGDPQHDAFYQLWAVNLPGGIPNGMQIFIEMDGNNTGVNISEVQSNATAVRNCTSIDKNSYFLWALPLPGGGVVSGASITTTQNEIILSISGVTDHANPQYHVPVGTVGWFQNGGSFGLAAAVYGASLFNATPQPPGVYNPAWGTNLPGSGPSVIQIPMHTLSFIPATSSPGFTESQTLQSLNFNLNIPVNVPNQGQVAAGCGETFGFVTPTTLPVSGIEVVLTGSQTDLSPDAVLTVQLQLPDGTLSPVIKTTQMPLSPGTVTLGSPNDLWGFSAMQINAALLDDPNFAVNIVAHAPNGELVTFTVSAQVLVAFAVPDPPPNIDYLKSFEQTAGELNTLVLGSNGTLYLEDAINAPDVLTPLFTRIFPNSFAQSVTQDDREYIGVSNLLNGTDIPRVYSPPNLDRLSQVGPGAAPSAVGSNAGGTIPIVSITQPSVKSDPENPGHLSGILWSAGPGSTDQGNVLTIYYGRSFPPGPLHTPDPDLAIGVGVTIAGADTANPNNQFNGQLIDGNYTVTSVGEGVPPGAQFGRWYFTVQVPVTQFVNQADHITANAPDGTYQVTTATLTASAPVPNLQIGSTMQVSGTGGAPPAGYDGSWIVTDTTNAAQLQITSTQLSGNVATYSYFLISGSNPAVGERVTVGETLNGNGIFNVSNATITAASAGTFSINLVNPDVAPAAENGTGVIAGTIFKFEPGQPVGTRTTGFVVVVGNFAFGQRKVCYSFLKRNGSLTQPSPIFLADIVIGSTGIAVSNLLTGPSNVIARVIHFTGANGGQFYNIPDPVIVVDPITGQKIVNDSTWVMDNVTTNVVLSFSDEVLLAADEIDIQGNNLFACYELGSCIGFIPYAARLAAVGEQNKVFNFRNHSFDGGVGGGGANQTYPAGWTVDPANGAGGSVVDSPIFGSAYQISNATGSTQAVYGMISQSAYKDEFLVDIINASTTYSVRVTAAVAAAVASGNLIIDLFSASLARSVGTFTLPLNLLTTSMQLFSGTLLTAMLAPVPQDLLLRIYAQNIPDGATVIIDREEPFPTEKPNLDTQVILSYANNFEAFDRITGVINPSIQNQQPVKSGFVLFDTLYLVKSNSIVGTNDNGTTEPVVAGGGWVIRTISQSIGTTGIYGVTTAIDQPNSGEDWAILAGRAGAYIYDGGEPVKLSEEIQSLWNQINWKYGHTIWVLNDIINRRLLFGVPLRTSWLDPQGNLTRGNWLPAGIVPENQNPTTPNVVLELNYKQLNTAGALASSVGIHRSYSGKLIASDITRKWALWTIKAPSAAFLTRADGTNPVFFGNSDGNGKIFELVDGLQEDDGSPFPEIYMTSPFLPRQQAQGEQLGVLRYGFDYMTLMIQGQGHLTITVFPNTLDTPYSHDLLPDLEFPLTTNGDAEVPVDEEGNRLFVQFGAKCVGSTYTLSGLVMFMSPSGYAPVSGRNG